MKKVIAITLATLFSLATGLAHAGLNGDKVGQDNRQHLVDTSQSTMSYADGSNESVDSDFDWSKSNNKKR
ncbi:hypothetical protein JCM19241_5175 [Vibrio ishigakensis]|uniref:Uncharacterized protein n=1 Tax=Vibrio ishigakensis TaxID=1481914 RepID=A0A0B8QH84_9VIBR|nr:hypothetical protein JCM19241_5175 [Vibrio ishigakensis]